jgi:hypothetical protein
MRRMMLHPGEALDHQRDAVKGPQFPGEPVGRRPFEQGLLHAGELLIGKPWRRAARPSAVQGLGTTGLPAGMPDAHGLGRDLELAGDLGLGDAGGEQLGRAQPAGLQAVTFSLCRRAARDSWHAPDPRLAGDRAPT